MTKIYGWRGGYKYTKENKMKIYIYAVSLVRMGNVEENNEDLLPETENANTVRKGIKISIYRCAVFLGSLDLLLALQWKHLGLPM